MLSLYGAKPLTYSQNVQKRALRFVFNKKTCLFPLVNFIIVFIYLFGSRRPILIVCPDCLLNLIGFNLVWVLLKMCENS